jgi:hypothetical protein
VIAKRRFSGFLVIADAIRLLHFIHLALTYLHFSEDPDAGTKRESEEQRLQLRPPGRVRLRSATGNAVQAERGQEG